jgi:hypothetical protein
MRKKRVALRQQDRQGRQRQRTRCGSALVRCAVAATLMRCAVAATLMRACNQTGHRDGHAIYRGANRRIKSESVDLGHKLLLVGDDSSNLICASGLRRKFCRSTCPVIGACRVASVVAGILKRCLAHLEQPSLLTAVGSMEDSWFASAFRKSVWVQAAIAAYEDSDRATDRYFHFLSCCSSEYACTEQETESAPATIGRN